MISTTSPKVLSLYEGFFSGGARILHSDAVIGLHKTGQRHSVLSIHREVYRETMAQHMADDPRYQQLVNAGVSVTSLDRGYDVPSDTFFTEAEIAVAAGEIAKADVVLSLKEQPLRLLDHPSIPRRPTIACLHRSDPENQGSSLGTLQRAVNDGRVTRIVCCATSTRDAYVAAGLPLDVMRVIPNGVDVTRFRPNQVAHMTLRRQLRISRSAPVVVFAARYDEMKNVGLFVNAARIFLNEHPEGHVLMCGAGMDAANEALAKQLLPLPKRVHLLGVQKKMENIYPAADIVALTSAFGEAAPLCLIEGMMCGAVPVATAVGDCEAIVDGRGLITTFVPEDVATAWSYAIAHRKYFLPELLASRAQFDRARMIAAYGELIQELAPVAL